MDLSILYSFVYIFIQKINIFYQHNFCMEKYFLNSNTSIQPTWKALMRSVWWYCLVLASWMAFLLTSCWYFPSSMSSTFFCLSSASSRTLLAFNLICLSPCEARTSLCFLRSLHTCILHSCIFLQMFWLITSFYLTIFILKMVRTKHQCLKPVSFFSMIFN